MAYSKYFGNAGLRAAASGTGFQSKYFQSGQQMQTPDFSAFQAEKEQTRQAVQTLQNRPYAVDEQAFGVPRQTGAGTVGQEIPVFRPAAYRQATPEAAAENAFTMQNQMARTKERYPTLLQQATGETAGAAPPGWQTANARDYDPEIEAWLQGESTRLDMEKYADKQYKDNFWGQTGASWAAGTLAEESNAAWARYLDDPSEVNRMAAERADLMEQQFQANNKETLADDASLSWISQSLAGYGPQALRQTAASAAGAGLGALVSQMTGLPVNVTTKAGAVGGSGAYSYNNMKGAAFRTLVGLGVDEETAREAAKDEAVVSSIIEMGDTALTLFTTGANKLLNSLGKEGIKGLGSLVAQWAGENAAKKLAVSLAKYGINIAGEGAEEGLQELVSIANQRRAQEGDLSDGAWGLAKEAARTGFDAVSGKDKSALEQSLDAAKQGMILAGLTGGGEVVANAGHLGYQGYNNLRDRTRQAQVGETAEQIATAPAEPRNDSGDPEAVQSTQQDTVETAETDAEEAPFYGARPVPQYQTGDIVIDKKTGKRYEVDFVGESGAVHAMDADNKQDFTDHVFSNKNVAREKTEAVQKILDAEQRQPVKKFETVYLPDYGLPATVSGVGPDGMIAVLFDNPDGSKGGGTFPRSEILSNSEAMAAGIALPYHPKVGERVLLPDVKSTGEVTRVYKDGTYEVVVTDNRYGPLSVDVKPEEMQSVYKVGERVYLPQINRTGKVTRVYRDGVHEVEVADDQFGNRYLDVRRDEMQPVQDNAGKTEQAPLGWAEEAGRQIATAPAGPRNDGGGPVGTRNADEAAGTQGAADPNKAAVPGMVKDRAASGSETGNAHAAASEEAPSSEAENVKGQPIPKKAFQGTPAMERLGIRVDGSVAGYGDAKQLLQREADAGKARWRLKKRAKELGATDNDMERARSIADGVWDPNSLRADAVNVKMLQELAGLYSKVRSFNEDRVYNRRWEIREANSKIIDKVFGPIVDKGTPTMRGPKKALSKIVMNERQTERAVKQVFGKEAGQAVYDQIFRPVGKNRAEKTRFINAQRERIRFFRDSSGENRALTKDERAMVQHLIEGKAAVDAITTLPSTQQKRVMDAAKAVNDGMGWEEATSKYDISKSEKLMGLAQAYADYMEAVTVSEAMDTTILDNAVERYSEVYSDFYEAFNDFLVAHGYKPIGFIKGYAPHFQKKETQESFFGVLRQLAGVEDGDVKELPAAIAGRTADFKPNMKWNPHRLTREGKKTDYDIEYGFKEYLDYAAEMFYHMDDIMRVRAAEAWFREKYSPEGNSKAFQDARSASKLDAAGKQRFLVEKGQLSSDSNLSAEDVDKRLEDYWEDLKKAADPKTTSKYSEFVTWLQNYANILAGKQSLSDRGMEFDAGREALNWFGKLKGSFSQANIVGNIASAINQTSQLAQIQAEKGWFLEQAMWDAARGKLAREGFRNQSDYLTDKAGKDKLNVEIEDESALVRWMSKPSEIVDQLVSTLAVRSRYLEALHEGLDQDAAMQEADDYARRVMGSRGRGDQPQAFESKKFTSKMIHAFQLEPSNTIDRFITDFPEEFQAIRREKGLLAAHKHAAGYAAKYLITALVFNQIGEWLYGGTPAPLDLGGWLLDATGEAWGKSAQQVIEDLVHRLLGTTAEEDEEDEKKEFEWETFWTTLMGNASDDIPYWQNVSALMGWGEDQSLPAAAPGEALSSLGDAASAVWEQTFQGEKETGMDWTDVGERVIDDLLTAAVQFVPGARQAQKTAQGVKAVSKGGKMSGYGDDEKLAFVVEPGFWKTLQAGLFGPNATSEAREYYASGNKPLSAKQTENVLHLENMYDIDREMTYDLYQAFREIDGAMEPAEAAKAKRERVNELDLDDYDKVRIYTTLTGKSGSTAAKYRAMLDKGLTWDQVTEAENQHAALKDNEDLSATERAREFEAWMDEEDLTIAQRRTMKAMFGGSAAEGDDRYEYLSERLDSGVPEMIVMMSLSDSELRNYQKVIKPGKVPAETYLDALTFAKKAKSDLDKAGKEIKGQTRKDKITQYLHGLDLNKRQKRALWIALGYSESTSPW